MGDRLLEQGSIVECVLEGVLERIQRAVAHGCGSPLL